MKKIYILLMICFSIVNSYSQTGTDKKNTIDVYIVPSYGAYGGGNGVLSGVGIDYSRRLTERWSLGGGVERIAITGTYKDVYLENQIGDEVVYEHSFKRGLYLGWVITSIPVQLKYHLSKTFFFNFGPSLDISTGFIESELGLGLRAGIGFEHEFKNGILLTLNPYFKTDFSSGDVGYYQIAVNLGIGYRF